MNDPVILFEGIINNSGVRGKIIYYYEDNKFYQCENWCEMIDVTNLIIPLSGDEITFEEFIKLGETYHFDGLVDSVIREHQLKNLLS